MKEKLRQWLAGYNIRHMTVLLVMFLTTMFLWNSAIIHPFKVFVVMAHELSHGLAAILTGGRIERIQIDPNLGGVCYTVGGIRGIILSAGYLGSMLVGSILLAVASRTDLDKLLSVGFGILLLWVTIRYVTNQYGQAFGIMGGSFMVIIGIWGSLMFNELFWQYIGLTSILYAVLDIYDDTIHRNISESDAGRFAEHFGLTTVFWGWVWMIIAIVVGFFMIRWSVRKQKPQW